MLVLLVPEALQLGVCLAVAQRKIFEALSLLFNVFDVLPSFGDQLHDLLGIQMLVTWLLLDLFPLLLTEKNVWR